MTNLSLSSRAETLLIVDNFAKNFRNKTWISPPRFMLLFMQVEGYLKLLHSPFMLN